MKYCKKIIIHLLLLTMVVCGITGLIGYIQQTAKLTHLLADEDTKELLRQQQIPEEMYDTFKNMRRTQNFPDIIT